jgi:hypothetical protein
MRIQNLYLREFDSLGVGSGKKELSEKLLVDQSNCDSYASHSGGECLAAPSVAAGLAAAQQ